jgi:hypothetical protein
VKSASPSGIEAPPSRACSEGSPRDPTHRRRPMFSIWRLPLNGGRGALCAESLAVKASRYTSRVSSATRDRDIRPMFRCERARVSARSLSSVNTRTSAAANASWSRGGTKIPASPPSSSAELRGGGPILFPGMKAKGGDRDPTTSNRHRHPLALEAGGPKLSEDFYATPFTKPDARRHPPGSCPPA